ncbi:MAG: hypothetical protein ABSA17_06380 [Rhabdochlamydiaceae bacterium]
MEIFTYFANTIGWCLQNTLGFSESDNVNRYYNSFTAKIDDISKKIKQEDFTTSHMRDDVLNTLARFRTLIFDAVSVSTCTTDAMRNLRITSALCDKNYSFMFKNLSLLALGGSALLFSEVKFFNLSDAEKGSIDAKEATYRGYAKTVLKVVGYASLIGAALLTLRSIKESSEAVRAMYEIASKGNPDFEKAIRNHFNTMKG